MGSGFEDAGHLGDLDFEQLAEERTDVDAGKKSPARPERWAARA